MGDSPDRITSAPTVRNNTVLSDNEDVFLPSKSQSHNSHSRHSKSATLYITLYEYTKQVSPPVPSL